MVLGIRPGLPATEPISMLATNIFQHVPQSRVVFLTLRHMEFFHTLGSSEGNEQDYSNPFPMLLEVRDYARCRMSNKASSRLASCSEAMLRLFKLRTMVPCFSATERPLESKGSDQVP